MGKSKTTKIIIACDGTWQSAATGDVDNPTNVVSPSFYTTLPASTYFVTHIHGLALLLISDTCLGGILPSTFTSQLHQGKEEEIPPNRLLSTWRGIWRFIEARTCYCRSVAIINENVCKS